MTKREMFLKALRNEPVPELVWAPNFDYWLGVNKAEGTLPAKYAGMARNDIVRAIGGTIWNRAEGLRVVLDPAVRETWREANGDRIHEFHTPLGAAREVYQKTEGEHRSRFLAEHFIKDLPSLKVMRFVAEATHYEANYEPTRRALAETGPDGVVLHQCFCVPFIQFCKTDAGYINGFYLWTDQRREVDDLIAVYFRNFLQGFRILADGPADLIAAGDNMDGTMISPDIFREYAIPFYREVKKICAARGKLFEAHWCGRTGGLLPLVPGCGLDIVEAVVTRPMADISLAEALARLRGEVVLQGGLPAVLVCREGGSRADFERYLRDEILPLKGRRGFVLGMADNVPPNADFARVESVAELIRG
jgi:hypothetical protein